MSKPVLLLVALSGVLLSACVVAPYPRQAAYAGPVPVQANIVVDVAPPAPYVEVVPVRPFVGALWIAGYWGWHGSRHHWVPGRWEQPRPGYAWRPYGWAQQGRHWHLHPGGWVRG